ncbi:hypothetical protein [Acidisoma sp.]|uniref:hypothetical protein n=1 Tax=Acidisoma sp. TaxID=1872115 RepID=UPI003AFFEE93
MSNSLTISGSSHPYNFIPANIKYVYDFSTNDTIEGGAGSASTYLHHNTTWLGTGGHGHNKIYAEGKDTIFAGNGALTVVGGSQALLFIGGRGPAHVDLGSGSASLFGSIGPVSVDGGSGTVTFDDKVSKGHDFFKTGTGQAQVTLGGGSATVEGGTGASTVTAGTGHDIFEFVASHSGGSEIIKDFNPHKDKIEFSGHFTSIVEKMAVGGLEITLKDGTKITHITLSGYDHDVKL